MEPVDVIAEPTVEPLDVFVEPIDVIVEPMDIIVEPVESEDEIEEEAENTENVIDELAEEIKKLKRYMSDKELCKGVKNLGQFMKKNNNPKGLSKLTFAFKNIECGFSNIRKKIRVNPAAIQRRMSGRGSTSAIQGGRHSRSYLQARKIVKAKLKHDLKSAIKMNKQNGGKF